MLTLLMNVVGIRSPVGTECLGGISYEEIYRIEEDDIGQRGRTQICFVGG